MFRNIDINTSGKKRFDCLLTPPCPLKRSHALVLLHFAFFILRFFSSRLHQSQLGLIVAIFFLLFPVFTYAQVEPQPTKTRQDTVQKIDIDHADVFEYIQKGDTVIQKLDGNVELSQDSVYMYCDTAIIENRIDVEANGNVLIQQGDSVSVFADTLVYDGALRIADLFGNVILVNQEQELFTDRLNYDLNTKIASYFSGATLTNDTTQLTSKRGYYHVDEQVAYFKDSVVVVDPNFQLRSDTLKFNMETKIVTFLGPTLISNDSSKIYCEGGFYDTENNLAEFTIGAQYQKGEQQAVADTIRYDGNKKEYSLIGNASFEEGQRKATGDHIVYNEETDVTFLSGNADFRDSTQHIVADEIIYDGKNETYSTKGRSVISDPPQILEADAVDFEEETGQGVAKGNVVWQDTSAQITIVCEVANYSDKSKYLKASGGRGGRPLLITMMEGDSLFMTSDTLLSFPKDTLLPDSTRVLIAYNDVRVFKSDLQAVSDSLSYDTQDSMFHFFYSPLIWSDTSQFSADTVDMVLEDEKIDKIFLRSRAFIINSPDEVFFNQVKGKNITARFREEELREMEVNGNAESVYYALDEGGAYVGVNETICSDMLLFFGNNEVEKIKFFSQPKAKLHPMKQVNHNSLRIEGFNWETKFRPLKFEDLFAVWPERPIFRPPPPPPPTTPPAEELPEPPPENVPEGVDKAGTN